MQNRDWNVLPGFLRLTGRFGRISGNVELFAEVESVFTFIPFLEESVSVGASSEIEVIDVEIVWKILHHLWFGATFSAFGTKKNENFS